MKEFRRRQYEEEITFLKGSIQYAQGVKESFPHNKQVLDGQDRHIRSCTERLEHIYAKMRYLVTNE